MKASQKHMVPDIALEIFWSWWKNAERDIQFDHLDRILPLLASALTVEIVTRLKSKNSRDRVLAAKASGCMRDAAYPELISALIKSVTSDPNRKFRKIGNKSLDAISARFQPPDLPLMEIQPDTSDNLSAKDENTKRDDTSEAVKFELIRLTHYLSSAQFIKMPEDKRRKTPVLELESSMAISELLPILTQFLRTADTTERWRVVSEFKRMGRMAVTDEVLALLTEWLGDPDVNLWATSYDVLREYGEKAATPLMLARLMELLSDSSKDACWRAAEAIHLMGNGAVRPDVVERLTKLVGDSHSMVRENSAKALGSMGSADIVAKPEVVAVLTNRLSDRYRYVRHSAVRALGRIGSVAATEETLQELARLLKDRDPVLRESVLFTFKQMGRAAIDSAILPPILGRLRDSDEHVRRRAAAVLVGFIEAGKRWFSSGTRWHFMASRRVCVTDVHALSRDVI